MSDESTHAVLEAQQPGFLPIASIRESTLNPRRAFDEAALAELTASIRVKGALVPLLVRRLEEEYARNDAARKAWKEASPAIIDVLRPAIQKLKLPQLLKIIMDGFGPPRPALLKRLGLPTPKTAADALVLVAAMVLVSWSDEFNAYQDFPPTVKALGLRVDLAAILKAQAVKASPATGDSGAAATPAKAGKGKRPAKTNTKAAQQT